MPISHAALPFVISLEYVNRVSIARSDYINFGAVVD